MTSRLRIEQVKGRLFQLVDVDCTAKGFSATSRRILSHPTKNLAYIRWMRDELTSVCGRGRAYNNSKILPMLEPR